MMKSMRQEGINTIDLALYNEEGQISVSSLIDDFGNEEDST